MQYKVGEFDKYEEEFIKSTYLFFTDTEIAAMLNRTPMSINMFRTKKGWKKQNIQEDICKKIPIVFINSIEDFELDLTELKEFM